LDVLADSSHHTRCVALRFNLASANDPDAHVIIFRATCSTISRRDRKHLSEHVNYLSVTIGERNLSKAGTLEATADYIKRNLQQAGYPVTEQSYSVQGHQVSNLEAQLAGSDGGGPAIVVGAHYDSVINSPGANDNASGVAAVLVLARMLHGSRPRRTVRFVLFVNEEPPYFQTENMGSLVYARQLRRDQIPVVAMISLETIGFYSDASGSQKYPELLGLFIRSAAISSASLGIRLREHCCARQFVNFGRPPIFHPKASLLHRSGRELVGRTIGRFGKNSTQPSWSLTRRYSDTLTTTLPMTRRIAWISRG
jgi:hypothetical protein